MKKIFTILCLMAVTMMAQAQTPTYTISKSTGTFTSGNSGNTWFNTWTSNSDITPTATLKRTSGTNDMQWDGNKFKFNANGGIDYTITLPETYTIEKLEATFSDNTARESFVTINGVQKRIDAGQTVALTFDGLSGNTVTMKLQHNANAAGNRFMRTEAIVLTYREMGEMANVKFKVVDVANNPLDEKTIQVEVGQKVTDIPANMKRDFTSYTYSPQELTVAANVENEFTATATFNTPFEISADFSNAKWYYLNLKGGTGYPTYVEGGSPNVTLPTSNAENDNTSWAFVGNPYAGFTIYNKAAGDDVILGSESAANDGANGGNTYATLDAAGEKTYQTWTIESSDAYTNGFIIRNGEGIGLNHRSAANLAFWTGGTGTGSTFVATKVPESELTFIEALDNLENGKVYAIYNARGIWKFAENATKMTTASSGSLNLDALSASPAAEYQIGIVKQDNKYYLYNVTQKKYLTAANTLYDSPLEPVTITASTSNAATGNYKWFFAYDSSHNINVDNQGNVLIDTWTSHDGGNVNAILVTDATYTVDDALAAFTDYTQCVTDYCDYKGIKSDLTQHLDELGYPKAGTEATTDIAAILERNAAGENSETDWTTFVEKYNAFIAADNIRKPEVGNFYRIKGVVSGLYMQSHANTTQINRLSATADGTDATTIFYFDNGNKLLGYANGMYPKTTSDPQTNVANNAAEAQAYTITPHTLGEFAIKGSGYLYSWPATEKEAPYFDRNGNTWHERCRMTIEEVTTLPITLRRTSDDTPYFATFSAPVNVRISGASLNTVTNNNKTAAYNTVDTDMLKAGVGVLLSGTSPTATATIITDEVDEADYGLVKYYAATAGTGDESKLYLGKGKTSGKAGFYKLGEDTTSNGFKAYLNNTTELVGAKEGLELEFAGVTGIENMEHGTLNMENGAVYNLQGQRVNKAQKGVYIINNKKVVVK